MSRWNTTSDSRCHEQPGHLSCGRAVRRYGPAELQDVITRRFAQRAGILKSHNALVAVRQILERHPVGSGNQLANEIAPLLADTHALDEPRLLAELTSRTTTLTERETTMVSRLLGGTG